MVPAPTREVKNHPSLEWLLISWLVLLISVLAHCVCMSRRCNDVVPTPPRTEVEHHPDKISELLLLTSFLALCIYEQEAY